MARATEKKVEKKPKSGSSRGSGGGVRKKLTVYNKFMKDEMSRLKENEPDISHQDRFKQATANWKTAKENPKNAA
ncbi:hypothetical protein HGRIS_008410 [Hohenbuehelia grisea]|uniref:YABBY protein C-terminal domain-containing protein n=1 Tax=Hohenbuehelia grisea TaxID=104357 RepID=A0ABR3J7V4_9AGAR